MNDLEKDNMISFLFFGPQAVTMHRLSNVYLTNDNLRHTDCKAPQTLKHNDCF